MRIHFGYLDKPEPQVGDKTQKDEFTVAHCIHAGSRFFEPAWLLLRLNEPHPAPEAIPGILAEYSDRPL